MTLASIQLLGFENKNDVTLYSKSNAYDHPVRQIIRYVNVLRCHKDATHPTVVLGRFETADEPSAYKWVVLKYSRNLQALASLEREYSFYAQQLASLQGSVIPKCFGLFKGTSCNLTLGCLVLEHCQETQLRIKVLTDFEDDEDEYIRRFISGICKIHKLGVFLNHKGKHQVLRQNREPRIIDFAQATTHVCPGALPALNSMPAKIRSQNIKGEPACRELVAIEEEFAFGYKPIQAY
ncbi:hypothetical protein BJ912DRAFT_1063980 [Pholiota molesta]|nr:hypothetical protein BJ912DRAFT_1063980 [Pholiota molesta]